MTDTQVTELPIGALLRDASGEFFLVMIGTQQTVSRQTVVPEKWKQPALG